MRGRGFETGQVTFDMDKGDLLLGFALVATPPKMGEALAKATAQHAGPGDVRRLPHWTILVAEVLPLNSHDGVSRQIVMPPDITIALLGQLQGWHARMDRELPTRAAADQLDALRAQAAAEWASSNWRG